MKDKAFQRSWRKKMLQIAKHLTNAGKMLQEWERLEHGDLGNRVLYRKIQSQLEQAKKDIESLGYLCDHCKDFSYQDELDEEQARLSPVQKPKE